MKIIDHDHPFYRPLWRRLLIVGICVSWTALEYYNGDQVWSTITLVIAAYAFANLILFFKPSEPKAPSPEIEEEAKSSASDPSSSPQ